MFNIEKKMGKYLCTYCPGHARATKEGYVYTHVLMAEKKLGRKLKSEEVVHHIDECKYNNEFDNLIVFKTNADHAAFHKGCEIELHGDVYVAKMYQNLICPICGELKDNKAKMCVSCHSISRRKVIRPDYITLFHLICIYPFIQIGKWYGVSDNSIRKWCKSYGLPYKQNDIKLLKGV